MKNPRFITILTFFLLLTANSNAMPSTTEILKETLLFPLKVITKPLIWWRYGYERKSDEFKVEITYNLELDGKPLTITKAINCEIYEGVFRWSSDGIKRPSRRVESIRQTTHKIDETNEILILPIPGYCEVDQPFKEEKIIDQNGKIVVDKNGEAKTKIIPIPNQTKSFIKISDKVIQSPAIAKFSKENPTQIDRIERIISPKLYQSPNVRIKLKSFSFKTETKEEPIITKLVDPKVENRFSWINGKAKTDKLPKWGTYRDEDKGIYAAFGMFKYPKEIWSKIPILNDFILKATKGKKDQNLFYFSLDNFNREALEIHALIKVFELSQNIPSPQIKKEIQEIFCQQFCTKFEAKSSNISSLIEAAKIIENGLYLKEASQRAPFVRKKGGDFEYHLKAISKNLKNEVIAEFNPLKIYQEQYKNHDEIVMFEVLEKAKHYLAGMQSYNSLDRYFGSLGIAGNTETSILAKTVADSNGIMEVVRGKDIYLGQKWVPKKGKEEEFQKIYQISNYRDYYYPFTFNKAENIWEVAEDKKGWLMIEKINDLNSISLGKDAYDVNSYVWTTKYKIFDNLFEDKTGKMILFYNPKTEELILPDFTSATYLK